MELRALEEILSQASTLRDVLESKKLAQLGDFLANFIYSSVKIGGMDINGSVHVWDRSLTAAMELSNLRGELGKKAKPDKVADSAEALIAFAYFKKLLSLDEMTMILSDELKNHDISTEKKEKIACGVVFSKLLTIIVNKATEENMIERKYSLFWVN